MREEFEKWWKTQETSNIHINSAIGSAAYQAWQAAWDYRNKHTELRDVIVPDYKIDVKTGSLTSGTIGDLTQKSVTAKAVTLSNGIVVTCGGEYPSNTSG